VIFLDVCKKFAKEKNEVIKKTKTGGEPQTHTAQPPAL
jgi:hypothetical protein